MAAPVQIFVSYSHRDSSIVREDVAWLESESLSLFIDDRIDPGTAWPDELADALSACSVVLFFASDASVESPHCANELTYAADAGKRIVTVYITPCEVGGGIRLLTSRSQNIARWQLPKDEYRRQVRFVLEGDVLSARVQTEWSAAPSLWLVPLTRNARFSGRDDLLSGPDPLFQGQNIAALTGQAGVGKTQIALEYLHQLSKVPSVVCWVRSDSESSLIGDLVDIAMALKISDPEESDTPQILLQLQTWFAVHKSWLLVLDNLESFELLERFFPPRFEGRLLITSRQPDWGRVAQVSSVEPFTPKESRQFLKLRTGSDTIEDIDRLSAVLGHLPLAIEEAAAYIESSGRSIRSYVALFEQHHDMLMSDSELVPEYPGTLRSTLTLSIDALRKEAPDALLVLKRLAFFAPDNISRTILESLPLGDVDDSGHRTIHTDRITRVLRRYSLVKAHNDALSIHRLTQLIVFDEMSNDERCSAAFDVLDCISAQFPRVSDMGSSSATCRRILPHALSAISHGRSYSGREDLCGVLLSRVGTFLSAQNRSSEASALLADACLILKNRAEQRSKYARASELRGRVLFANGDLEAAHETFAEALNFFETEGDAGALHVMQVELDLAWVDWTRGELRSAINHAARSTNMLRELTGPDDPHLAIGNAILARLYLELGDTMQALKLANDTAAAIPSLPTPDKSRMPLLCAVFVQLAQVFRLLGFPERARSWVQESLKLGASVYNESHPLMAATNCILGQISLDEEDFSSAYIALKQATESADASPFPVNQQIYIAFSFLALAQIEVGQHERAQQIISDRLSDTKSRVAGDKHWVIAYGHLARGKFALTKGDALEAEVRFRKSDSLLVKRSGQTSPLRLPALFFLIETAIRNEKIEDAFEILEQARSIIVTLNLTTSQFGGRYHELRAQIESERDLRIEARSNLIRAMEIYKLTLRPESAPISRVRERLNKESSDPRQLD